ncbi:hypothetical protein [Solimonas sp. K1W22B-7]|nr:hypothetical protein [Solimonas sp. K1W22B-7]
MRITAKFSAGIEARRATGHLRPGSGERGTRISATAPGGTGIRQQDSG